MDVVVMAGGKGTRLNMGEKPMAMLNGRPLIEYVISAIEAWPNGNDIYVAVTDNVPNTARWANIRGLKAIPTHGMGYVPDMIHAVKTAGIKGPVMLIMADLPLITPELLERIRLEYSKRPEPALSTHTSLDLNRKIGRRPDALFNYRGDLIVPAGINILEASMIEHEQADYHLILDRIEIAVNVNTAEDLKLCESILSKRELEQEI